MLFHFQIDGGYIRHNFDYTLNIIVTHEFKPVIWSLFKIYFEFIIFISYNDKLVYSCILSHSCLALNAHVMSVYYMVALFVF